MKIKSVSIVGLGLIGGSIAKALKSAGHNIEICGYARNPETIKTALADKAIDRGLYSLDEISRSDVVFICLPVDTTIEYFDKVAPLLKKNSILTDVASVKTALQDKWDSLTSEGIYFGGHPMTGKEKGGYDSSDPLLFENSVYILSEFVKNHPMSGDFITLIDSLGCRVTFLDPKLHDKIVANVSHLPQLLSVALVNSMAQYSGDTRFIDFAAGGFRDMTRIASSLFNIWDPIVLNNKESILSSFDRLMNELEKMKKEVVSGNMKSLEADFDKARITRDEIPKTRKGFITPIYDISIFIKDQPGVISAISTALYKENINIKDIELLKIREGTGGNFRLSFESEEAANRAKEIIRKIGFEAI